MVSLVICAMVLACAALYFASSVFAPLAFALFILAIVWPLQERLERSMYKGLALFITLTVTVIVMVMFVSMIAWALSAVGDWLLNNVQRFQAIYIQATDWLEGHGIFVAGTLAERFDVLWLLRLFKDIAWRINRLAGFGILVFVFLMMALLEVEQFRRQARLACTSRTDASSPMPAPRSPPSSAATCWCGRCSASSPGLPSGASRCSPGSNPPSPGACSPSL